MSLFLVMFFMYIHFFPLQTNLKRMKWRLVKPFSCTHVSCKPVVIGSPSPLEASQGIAAWACVCVHVISGGRTVPVRSWPGASISRGGPCSVRLWGEQFQHSKLGRCQHILRRQFFLQAKCSYVFHWTSIISFGGMCPVQSQCFLKKWNGLMTLLYQMTVAILFLCLVVFVYRVVMKLNELTWLQ